MIEWIGLSGTMRDLFRAANQSSFLPHISNVLAKRLFINHPFRIFTSHYFFYSSLLLVIVHSVVHIALLLCNVPFYQATFETFVI